MVSLKSLHLILSNSGYMEKLLVPKASILEKDKQKNKSDSENLSFKESDYVSLDEGAILPPFWIEMINL